MNGKNERKNCLETKISMALFLFHSASAYNTVLLLLYFIQICNSIDYLLSFNNMNQVAADPNIILGLFFGLKLSERMVEWHPPASASGKWFVSDRYNYPAIWKSHRRRSYCSILLPITIISIKLIQFLKQMMYMYVIPYGICLMQLHIRQMQFKWMQPKRQWTIYS